MVHNFLSYDSSTGLIKDVVVRLTSNHLKRSNVLIATPYHFLRWRYVAAYGTVRTASESSL